MNGAKETQADLCHRQNVQGTKSSIWVSRTPSRMVAQPPEFGEQTDEVLKEYGFGAEEIAKLRDAKVGERHSASSPTTNARADASVDFSTSRPPGHQTDS